MTFFHLIQDGVAAGVLVGQAAEVSLGVGTLQNGQPLPRFQPVSAADEYLLLGPGFATRNAFHRIRTSPGRARSPVPGFDRQPNEGQLQAGSLEWRP